MVAHNFEMYARWAQSVHGASGGGSCGRTDGVGLLSRCGPFPAGPLLLPLVRLPVPHRLLYTGLLPSACSSCSGHPAPPSSLSAASPPAFAAPPAPFRSPPAVPGAVSRSGAFPSGVPCAGRLQWANSRRRTAFSRHGPHVLRFVRSRPAPCRRLLCRILPPRPKGPTYASARLFCRRPYYRRASRSLRPAPARHLRLRARPEPHAVRRPDTPIQPSAQHAVSAPNREPSPAHPAEAVSRAGPCGPGRNDIVLTGSPTKRSLVPSHAFYINALSYRKYRLHHRALLSKWLVNGLNTACHSPVM